MKALRLTLVATALVAVALLVCFGTPDAMAAFVFKPISGDVNPGPALTHIAILGIIVNRDNLAILFQGFKTAFSGGLGMATPMWSSVATQVPSTTKEEKYAWLGQVPGVREWIGDRVMQNLALHDYAIKNKDYELTIGVDRNDIQDDTYGVLTPLFTEMGRSVAAHPDSLVYSLLKDGFDTVCYDGQNFFDTDHPVLDKDGNVQSVANTDSGSGTPWFLIDDSRAIKPILYQVRQAFNFVSKDQGTDDNVFMQKKFIYGVDGRCNVGLGFWQFAWGSKQTLDADHYQAARAGLGGMTGDYGRPLGLNGTTLVVPPSLEGKGRAIVNAQNDAAGATNVWFGTAKLLVVPWLS